jgi:hypothetical protein
VLTIRPAKNLQGKLELPPSADLFFLAIIMTLARQRPVKITPAPAAPLITQWQQTFAGHVDFSADGVSTVIRPVTNDPSLRVCFVTTDLPWRDITVFALLGMKKTVVFRSIDEKRIVFWKEQARRIGCILTSAPWESSMCLTIEDAIALPRPETIVDETDQDALCGLLLGASLQHSFVSNTVFLTPLRTVAPVYQFTLDVKNAVPKERDALARRIQLMQHKNKSAASGQQFIITANFSPCHNLPPEPAVMTLPGDALLGAVFTTAKCLYPKSSFTIGNLLLETWATPFLPFLRKIGCKVSVQETGRTSFGSTGMLTVQSGDLSGKKLECIPSVRFSPYLPSLAVIASFAKGESVFRELADLRNDVPDGIELIESCIRTLGARHGEMLDGIVLQGGTDFDGFDIPSPLPAWYAAAFAIAATRCIGSSTIDDTLLKEYFPSFDRYLATFFEYRDTYEKN